MGRPTGISEQSSLVVHLGVEFKVGPRQKLCKSCNGGKGKVKSKKDFSPQKEMRDGYRSSCRECNNSILRRTKYKRNAKVITERNMKIKLQNIPYIAAIRILRSDPDKFLVGLANIDPDLFRKIMGSVKADILEEYAQRMAKIDAGTEDPKIRAGITRRMQEEIEFWSNDPKTFIDQAVYHGILEEGKTSSYHKNLRTIRRVG